MRQIKFKGKRITDGVWVYGYYFAEGFGDDLHHYIKSQNGTDLVDPKTAGQFTGLLDKNGKEIYEWDVLLYIATNMSSMIVKFIHGCFVGEGLFNTLPLKDYLNAVDFESIEVTGNIHETQ